MKTNFDEAKPSPPDLGLVVREHRASWRGERLPVIATAALALLPWLALWRTGAGLGIAIGAGAVFTAVAGVAFVHAARDASTRLVVYEHGILWRRGSQHGAFLFADIRHVEVFSGAIESFPGGTKLELPPTGIRLDLADGSSVRLPASMSERGELFASLRNGVPRAALPPATARIRR